MVTDIWCLRFDLRAGHRKDAGDSGGIPAQVRFAALLSEPAEGKRRRRLTLVLRYLVRPGALTPLYAAVADLDVHPHLGKPLRVRPPAPSPTTLPCHAMPVASIVHVSRL